MSSVPGLTIIFSIVTLFLSIGFPIIFAIWFCRKYHIGAQIVIFGAITFTISQLLLRIPLIQLLYPIYPGTLPDKGWPLFAYSLFLSFTAALFEEGGRIITCRLLMKGKYNWRTGLALGLGHGGFEAIALTGSTYINNIILILMIQSGAIKAMENLDPAIEQGALALINTPSHLFLLAGYERVLAIICHIGFSLFIVYGLASKTKLFVFLPFIGHTLLNLPVLYISKFSSGVLVFYSYFTLFAALSLYWIAKVAPKMFAALEGMSENGHEEELE